MNKKLLFLLVVQVGLLTASSKKVDTERDEQKSSAPRTTTRYIFTPIHTKPMCEATRKKTVKNKEFLAESARIIANYAPILPAFAVLLGKKHGCEYYLGQPTTVTLQNGATYQKITARCFGCNFAPTFFHLQLLFPCKKIQTCSLTETKVCLSNSFKKHKGLLVDFNKGSFFKCQCYAAGNNVAFITTEEPKLPQQEETDDEFFV